MPRRPREKSETGIYHVIVRGINRQDIFSDDNDYQRYLETLDRTKNISGYGIYAYCLMNNHVHLLVKETKEDIGQVMKRIVTSYAHWYNSKHDRSGHVFQGRYKSECVEDDAYLMTVIRYIHNNPVKAGIVQKPDQYQWSSYKTYCTGKKDLYGLIEPSIVLKLFSEDKEAAIKQFRQFSLEKSDDTCLEDETPIRISDKQMTAKIKEILKGNDISDLQQMERVKRDAVLHRAKKIKGTSIRQIARITGIGYNIIYRA